jgi:hypothetical protein
MPRQSPSRPDLPCRCAPHPQPKYGATSPDPVRGKEGQALCQDPQRNGAAEPPSSHRGTLKSKRKRNATYPKWQRWPVVHPISNLGRCGKVGGEGFRSLGATVPAVTPPWAASGTRWKWRLRALHTVSISHLQTVQKWNGNQREASVKQESDRRFCCPMDRAGTPPGLAAAGGRRTPHPPHPTASLPIVLPGNNRTEAHERRIRRGPRRPGWRRVRCT